MKCKCGRRFSNHTSKRLELTCKCGETVTIEPSELVRTASKPEQPADKSPPFYIRMLTLLRSTEDKGPGDTAQRLLAEIGGERFKTLAKQIGIPCGCARRQEEWNTRWPYPNPPKLS